MANIPLRPLGAKFYGVWVGPTCVNQAYGDATGWDFAGRWQPYIDAIKALGANTIQYMGEPAYAYSGPVTGMTLAQYIARRRYIIEYCASIGLYVMPYAAYLGYYWLSDPGCIGPTTNADFCLTIAADAAMSAQYPNVIGYITNDEMPAEALNAGRLSTATMQAYITAQYNAAKAVVPADFGVCAAPNPGGNNNPAWTYSGTPATWIDTLQAYCDFFVFHPFHSPTISQSSAIRAAYPNKQHYMASGGGVNESGGDLTRISNGMGLVGANSFRGYCYWAGNDWAATEGMFNADLTNRTAKTGTFVTAVNGYVSPKRSIRPYRGKPRINALRNWGYA